MAWSVNTCRECRVIVFLSASSRVFMHPRTLGLLGAPPCKRNQMGPSYHPACNPYSHCAMCGFLEIAFLVETVLVSPQTGRRRRRSLHYLFPGNLRKVYSQEENQQNKLLYFIIHSSAIREQWPPLGNMLEPYSDIVLGREV